MNNSQIDYYKKIYKQFERLHTKTYFGMRTIFDDFCLMAMASHHNFLYTLAKFPIPPVYQKNYDTLEAEYKTTALKYAKYANVFPIFHEILADLTLAMKESPYDYLGKLYMDMNINSKCAGQFFTPLHICEFMAAITQSKEEFDSTIERQGYITMSDPCCGSGAMAIGLAKLVEKDFKITNIDTKVLFCLADLDLSCVRMSYLNMTLLGLSAHISHADSIADREFASYDTQCLQIALAQGLFRKKNTLPQTQILPKKPQTEIKFGQLSLF